MVASTNGDLYIPFSRLPTMEEGFQSSEDGSELHSPSYEGSYPPDARYTFGQLDFHDIPPALLPTAFDGRFNTPTGNAQPRDPHMLQTLQIPSSAAVQDLPPHLHPELVLHPHPIVDLSGQSTCLQSSTLGPADYAFDMRHSRPSDQHLRISHDPRPVYTSRHSTMISDVHTPEISLPSSIGKSGGSESSATSPRSIRRETSTVVIACRQCRARKIRCDSTRPICHNCTRRNNECEYDAVPKRRGPDKRPGTRQRSCKKRPSDSDSSPAKKRRKTDDELDGSTISFDEKTKDNATDAKKHHMIPIVDEASLLHSPADSLPLDTSIPSRHDPLSPKTGLSPLFRRRPSIMDPDLNFFGKSFPRPFDVNFNRHRPDSYEKTVFSAPLSPSVEFDRKTWWDQFLRTYPLRDIVDDLEFLFTSSNYWLSFIHIPTFFRDLQDPHRRLRMQPAFIMSALALATLMKSSELELGSSGRTRALYFRNAAQGLMEAACSSKNIDHTLAEAALILALFESSCHPEYSPERASCALAFLDRIIQILCLCTIDAHDPDASTFSPHAVPVVYVSDNYRSSKKCVCHTLSPGTVVDPLDECSTCFAFAAPWDPHWSDTEIRKEECRRLCWGALSLVANYMLQCSAFRQEPQDFALSDPCNYALLFPGEAYERVLGQHPLSGHSAKESLWALYCRSMLLWTSSARSRDDSWSMNQRSIFIMGALSEASEIQNSLDGHQCNMDPALLYVCREFLYNTKMTVTHELRRIQELDNVVSPMFDHRQAEDWLFYQDQISKYFKSSLLRLGEAPGHMLSRRPFQVAWLSNQITTCLTLFARDRSLLHALELAKSFLIPLDVLNALWPSPGQRVRRDELRQRLEEACTSANLHPPLPAELTLPPILRA
ncbi:hypothetical protein B0H21DRAFT_169579 [Amylocystis lapponica]|nr:hypothetical protein B0H21DRAFT_169579 [Amylocystis lapponica]